MKFRGLIARFAPLAVLCLTISGIAAPAHAQFWQCATFAREVSGIDIHGNANTWWNQAEGRYARGHAPQAGAVLAFAPTGRMPMGHVAMVSQVINDHEVLLTHANWSHPGKIEYDVRAVDVSPEGDWSRVKVWYARIGDLGTTTYATKGFIYSGNASGFAPSAELAHADTTNKPVQIAAADTAVKTFLALN